MDRPSQVLRHPEHIHPALWRATQLARPAGLTIPTGFPQLDSELPGQGWPVGQLIEILLERPGLGEVQLFRNALGQLLPERSVALVRPPYLPCIQAWACWHLAPERLLWIQPASSSDALWAAEQALRHNVCAAVFCWADPIRPASLRRLNLLARQSDSLCIVLRPVTASRQPSTAALRLILHPCRQGLRLNILKRQGAASLVPVTLQLYAARPAVFPDHAPVDLPQMA